MGNVKNAKSTLIWRRYLRLHLLDCISCADKFVVIFIDKHLHVALELLDFQGKLVASLFDIGSDAQ
jgi:hypothetical protein